MHPQFFKGRKIYTELGSGIGAGCFFFCLYEYFGYCKKTEDRWYKVNAGCQVGHVKVVAFYAADRIETDDGNHQSYHDRQPAFPEGLCANRGCHGKAKKHQCKYFWWTEGGYGPVGYRRCSHHHDNARNHTADGRAHHSGTNRLARFALQCHRIPVKCGRCIFRSPGNIKQNGCDSTAINAGTIDNRKQHDAVLGTQMCGEWQ